MALRIINIKGTSDYKRSDSWIDLWRQATGREPTRCYETNCFRTDLVGAHVQIEGKRHTKWYIVPLCHGANHRDIKSTEVREDALFMGVTDGQVYTTDDLRAELDY